METKRTYTEPAREIPIRDNVDILVSEVDLRASWPHAPLPAKVLK